MLMPPALNTFIRVPMSRHGIVHPHGGCGCGPHEKARQITEHEKYDNKIARFRGNEASETLFSFWKIYVSMLCQTKLWVFFSMTLVTEYSVCNRASALTFKISIKNYWLHLCCHGLCVLVKGKNKAMKWLIAPVRTLDMLAILLAILPARIEF